MGGTDVDVAAVEAEVIVLIGTVVMRSVHMEVVVLEEEMRRGIIDPMIGGDQEAVVLVVEEALEGGGIGVHQPGKVVLKEGLRLSNGTRKGNKQAPIISMTMLAVKMIGMVIPRMPVTMMIISRISVVHPNYQYGRNYLVCPTTSI